MLPAHLGWEAAFIHALRIHLNVVIPVATLLTKVLIRIFSREDFAEIMRSIANLPLELLLIAMSFMLGALSGMSEAYIIRIGNQSDADLFGLLVIIAIFFLSLFINRLMRFGKTLMGKLFVAHKQYRELVAQPTIPGTVPNITIVGRILWTMVYCILMVLVLVFCFGVTVITLAYVLHLIQ
jgi:ABC-type multidrug transport system permease subunit